MMKRLLDFLLATIGIVILAPFGFVFALMVKCEDGGPVFYVQERWGRGGRPFRAYKFRTMVPGADKRWGLKPAAQNDFRVTRVGKLLRATAMDELPQLLNIWKGDMSFVGPRALAVKELSPSFPGFSERHQVRPGLTGSAQIHAPRDAPLEDKFSYDLEYVRNRSLGADFKMLFQSLWITLRWRWESREKKV
jgi:lipopolysaccharide/colanic/teichoic acid biosynthesis glycosyltransferase